MKDERKIIIWNERLRKIRNNLREIIIQGVYNEIYILNTFSKLYGPPLDLIPEEEKEMYYLQGTIHKLNEALNKSICKCPICTQTDKDMVYIDLYETWYCVECQEKDLRLYHSQGSEENIRQHNYINWYYDLRSEHDSITLMP